MRKRFLEMNQARHVMWYFFFCLLLLWRRKYHLNKEISQSLRRRMPSVWPWRKERNIAFVVFTVVAMGIDNFTVERNMNCSRGQVIQVETKWRLKVSRDQRLAWNPFRTSQERKWLKSDILLCKNRILFLLVHSGYFKQKLQTLHYQCPKPKNKKRVDVQMLYLDLFRVGEWKGYKNLKYNMTGLHFLVSFFCLRTLYWSPCHDPDPTQHRRTPTPDLFDFNSCSL